LIQGSFTSNKSGKHYINWQEINSASDAITFHPVIQGDFSGGYYLNSRLPYTPADIYYFKEADDILVLVSGSLYNQTELLLHTQIASNVPNPELIANLFLLEGPGFVKKLNGDFAIFIMQQKKNQVYLFRDHAGIHPIAWTIDRQTICFSTNIIELCRVFSDRQTIRSDYLLGYFKYIDYSKTPNEKVMKLMPGHYIHYSDNGYKLFRYWEPDLIKIDKNLSHEQMVADLRILVNDAVRIRCDHNFNAGAHVSSGLDSGLVSLLARKEYAHQNDFYGFSWSPADFIPVNVKYDEREIVRKSCSKIDIKPLFSDMKEADFQRYVSSFYDNSGFFSEHKTVEQAVDVNTNLIFSGWGGDEFISTGDRGIEQDLLAGLKLRLFFRRNPVKHPRAFVRNLLRYVFYPALGILECATSKSFRDEARYIRKPYRKSNRSVLRNFYFHTSRRQLHIHLFRFYHLQERCESWSIHGFKNGVEYRYPLLDRRIIEYMLKVPSELLCKTDYFRPLLREISEGILSDDVRLSKYKTDPVYWAYMSELFKGSAISFIGEADEWKTNPNLYFIDFELLNRDIRRFRNRPDEVDQKVFFRALVYIKAVHEFLKRYSRS
jgi:asparagine synthase (glutamine-hydrolysing)